MDDPLFRAYVVIGNCLTHLETVRNSLHTSPVWLSQPPDPDKVKKRLSDIVPPLEEAYEQLKAVMPDAKQQLLRCDALVRPSAVTAMGITDGFYFDIAAKKIGDDVREAQHALALQDDNEFMVGAIERISDPSGKEWLGLKANLEVELHQAGSGPQGVLLEQPATSIIDTEKLSDYCVAAESIVVLLQLSADWPNVESTNGSGEIKIFRRYMARMLAGVLRNTPPDSAATAFCTLHGCGPFDLFGASGSSSHDAAYKLWERFWMAAKQLGGRRRLDWLIVAMAGIRNLHPDTATTLNGMAGKLEYEAAQVRAKLNSVAAKLPATPDAAVLPKPPEAVEPTDDKTKVKRCEWPTNPPSMDEQMSGKWKYGPFPPRELDAATVDMIRQCISVSEPTLRKHNQKRTWYVYQDTKGFRVYCSDARLFGEMEQRAKSIIKETKGNERKRKEKVSEK